MPFLYFSPFFELPEAESDWILEAHLCVLPLCMCFCVMSLSNSRFMFYALLSNTDDNAADSSLLQLPLLPHKAEWIF